MKTIAAAVRPRHWVKNLLLFWPLMENGVGDRNLVGRLLVAFAAFCFSASAVYLMNDIFDSRADAADARKSSRPIASGELGFRPAIILLLFFVLAAVFMATALPAAFAYCLALYFAANFLYSAALKHVPVLGLLLLAALYPLRIAAGYGVGFGSPPPPVFAVSYTLFLSLAALKKFSEKRKRQTALLGVLSGAVSLLLLGFFLHEGRMHTAGLPDALVYVDYLALAWWLTRIWLVYYRDRRTDHPMFFLVSDRLGGLVFFVLAAMGLVFGAH